MTPARPSYGVTFDFGQTLAELDADTLSRRVSERGHAVGATALRAALPGAWQAYNQAIREGHEGHPWHHLMEVLLGTAGLAEAHLAETVEWLWQEQPRYNLWRRPIAGMFELVQDLFEQGVPLGIISNSEGRLAELAEELGIARYFSVIGDSGRFGIPKPKPDIFLYVARELKLDPAQIIHIGDALAADVEGALNVGMKAIWFDGNRNEAATLGPSVRVAKNAHETRTAISELASSC
jgi:HAD superfamily hydrolase (TIGR01549 family)